MPALALLAARDPHAALAWRDGQPVSAAQFLGDVARQADLLPAVGPVVNLCSDRLRFAVGLGAALVRGHTSLLPPDALAHTLTALQSAYPRLVVLSDDAAPPGGLAHLVAPAWLLAPRSQPTPVGGSPCAERCVPRLDAALAAVCLLTSGSTGAPVPHTKTWGALVANIDAAAERLAAFLGRPNLHGLTLVATVPAQHSYGLESSVLLAWLGGAAFEASRPYYPGDIVRALASVPRPRALVTTPFHLKTLLQSGLALPPTDLVLCATAPLSPQLAQRAERAFGGPLVEIYGCTEAGQVATRRTAQGAHWRTLGQLRVRQQLAVAGSLSGATTAAADAGAIEDAVASHDAAATHGGPGDRFIVEGGHVLEPTVLADVLELQDAQRFSLLGRAGDLVHVAGRRTSLAYLDHHLNSIEGVLDGAFWMPDEVADGVVRPVAFVVAPTLGVEQVVRALRSRVEAVFVPRRVLHVAALPRGATGKLAAGAWQQFVAAELLRFERERPKVCGA